MRPRQIIAITGKLCSGKTSLAKYLVEQLGNSICIESSSIVKEVIFERTGKVLVDRGQMADVHQYDKLIQEKFLEKLSQFKEGTIILSGFRRWHHIQLAQPNLIIWIDCDDDVRFRRFCNRKDQKDDSSLSRKSQFEAFDEMDEAGLSEIKGFLDNRYSYFCLTNEKVLERMGKLISNPLEAPTIIFDSSRY